MFTSLTSQLKDSVGRIEAVLTTNESLRTMILDVRPAAAAEQVSEPESATQAGTTTLDSTCAEQLVAILGTGVPKKLDWQVYDHCAAFSLLYAAYEKFVNDLVSGYVSLLPELYKAYTDLPEAVPINHRLGIGNILLKIGTKKTYRDLEEAAVIRALSSGFTEGTAYTLVPEAFLVDRRNYKFDVLARIFGALGFDKCGQFLLRHPTVMGFMKSTRGESDTPQGELDKFVDYRNEAVHSTVENIVAVEDIRKIGQFICILCEALAEMVELAVIRRHMEMGHSIPAGVVQEVHYKGRVVVARMVAGAIALGEELIVYDSRTCRKVLVKSLQIDGMNHEAVELTDGQVIGIGLSAPARVGSELCRLALPSAIATDVQLSFEEPTDLMTDQIEIETDTVDPPPPVELDTRPPDAGNN